jgi:hypothetical protein
MNWGDNLSLIGAVRLGGWVTLATQWKAVKAKDFVTHDFNPIEAVWTLVKKYIRTLAPRTADTLRRVARAAHHAVDAYHGHQFFVHAGYVTSSARWVNTAADSQSARGCREKVLA